MKAKLSGLNGAVIGIVLIITVLLVMVSGSASTADVEMAFGGQGGGRPTPKPKRIPVKRRVHSTPRPRATTSVRNANNGNNASRERIASDNGNTNNGNRNASATPDANRSTSNTSGRPPVMTMPSLDPGANLTTPGIADPADKSKIVPVLTNSGSILRSPSPRKPSPDADILLPKDFTKLEGIRVIGLGDKVTIISPLPDPWRIESEPKNPLNTTGAFAEILGKLKVFVNVAGKAGDKITSRLKEYGRLEIVQTAREAEFVVHFSYWSMEVVDAEGIERTLRDGWTMIITIRDPLQSIPRIIWREDDTDGGWFKRGDAYDKLTKRFISELKRLRGEK